MPQRAAVPEHRIPPDRRGSRENSSGKLSFGVFGNTFRSHFSSRAMRFPITRIGWYKRRDLQAAGPIHSPQSGLLMLFSSCFLLFFPVRDTLLQKFQCEVRTCHIVKMRESRHHPFCRMNAFPVPLPQRFCRMPCTSAVCAVKVMELMAAHRISAVPKGILRVWREGDIAESSQLFVR